VLFVTLLLMLVGFLLVSGGLRSGDHWKHPWDVVTASVAKPAAQ
jgi:hypothetical protein